MRAELMKFQRKMPAPGDPTPSSRSGLSSFFKVIPMSDEQIALQSLDKMFEELNKIYKTYTPTLDEVAFQESDWG
jgi:hypothetical protein